MKLLPIVKTKLCKRHKIDSSLSSSWHALRLYCRHYRQLNIDDIHSWILVNVSIKDLSDGAKLYGIPLYIRSGTKRLSH